MTLHALCGLRSSTALALCADSAAAAIAFFIFMRYNYGTCWAILKVFLN